MKRGGERKRHDGAGHGSASPRAEGGKAGGREKGRESGGEGEKMRNAELSSILRRAEGGRAVSYTHLTLPTIC
eukprot:3792929-Rhodomonas_salina.2